MRQVVGRKNYKTNDGVRLRCQRSKFVKIVQPLTSLWTDRLKKTLLHMFHFLRPSVARKNLIDTICVVWSNLEVIIKKP